MGKLLAAIVAFSFLAGAVMLANAQAMGFESESNNNLKVSDPVCPKPEGKLEKLKDCLRCLPGAPKKKCNTRDDETASVWYSEVLNIKKGQILDLSFNQLQQDRAQNIATNPEVHATFEYISSTNFPVEFVSDPFYFGTHDVHLCLAHEKLKTMMDNARGGQPIFHQDFLNANVGLTVGSTQQLDQSLQVTYSFPAAKAWKAVEVMNRFASRHWELGVAKPDGAFFVNQAVQFLNDQDGEDHVKYFVFHMLQFFYNGHAGGTCQAGDYAKLIADYLLPRSNFYQFIRLPLGTKSVKATFDTAQSAIQMILGLQDEFVKFFTKKFGTSTLQGKAFPAGTCKKANQAWFALQYGPSTSLVDFPFSFETFITELWKDSNAQNAPQTLDLFRKFAPAFDRAIGLWPIGGNPYIVGFEARYFKGFVYPVAPENMQFAWKIPTFYNLGVQLNANNLNLNNLDVGLKTCQANQTANFVPKNPIPQLLNNWQNAGQRAKRRRFRRYKF